MQQHMARATTQQPVPSQPEELTPTPASSVPSGPSSQLEESTPGSSVASEDSSVDPRSSGITPFQVSESEIIRVWIDSLRRAISARRAVSSNQNSFWRKAFPRVANTCGIIGFLLAVIFGVTQWLAQDKSIAIAKESELITLALSCSDKEIKNTSICQQFLQRYPDGPRISRGEAVSADVLRRQGSKGEEPVRVALEDIAVHLAMMDRFLQKQNSRFQLALETGDVPLSPAQIEDIVRGEKFFLQNIATLKATLAGQEADNASPSPTTTSFTSLVPVVVTIVFLVVGVISILKTDTGLVLFLGLLVCVVDPMMHWVLLQVQRVGDWVFKLLTAGVLMVICFLIND
ncbi:hypothetical protein F4859DRAFT_456424 [Xylaria cf. heliscus]|nr:hypothetical protein F4859DRAFT_456424 [Xylaria cf. heliscus]